MTQEIITYMLLSEADNKFYVGITHNIQERLVKHNKGEIASTQNRRPLRLVYIKGHNSYIEARKHEKWLKKKSRSYKTKLAQLAPPMTGGVK